MSGYCKVIVCGRLGKDPEVRYAQSGDAIANISVATSKTWKDKSGEKQEKTEWHRVVVFGKTAEVCGKYLKKGSLALFEGTLQTRKWTDKEGVDRYSTEIKVDGFDGSMTMLGTPGGVSQQNDNGEGGDGEESKPASQFKKAVSAPAELDDSEIPF